MNIMNNNPWPTINMTATGQNINRLRQAAGLSVRALQNILGMNNPQAVYKWLRGETLPTLDNLVILAAVLQTPIDNIIVTTANQTAQSA